MSPVRTPPAVADAHRARVEQRLAREAKAIALAGDLLGTREERRSHGIPARCAEAEREWSVAEDQYRSATGGAKAQAAAASVLWMCDGCPVLDACRRWAIADRYSGLAAGAIFNDGREVVLNAGRQIMRRREVA